MKKALRERLIAHVNRKQWWHVPPVDPNAYKKRGKFLASSFVEAELSAGLFRVGPSPVAREREIAIGTAGRVGWGTACFEAEMAVQTTLSVEKL
jgi:hypothetical protein